MLSAGIILLELAEFSTMVAGVTGALALAGLFLWGLMRYNESKDRGMRGEINETNYMIQLTGFMKSNSRDHMREIVKNDPIFIRIAQCLPEAMEGKLASPNNLAAIDRFLNKKDIENCGFTNEQIDEVHKSLTDIETMMKKDHLHFTKAQIVYLLCDLSQQPTSKIDTTSTIQKERAVVE